MIVNLFLVPMTVRRVTALIFRTVILGQPTIGAKNLLLIELTPSTAIELPSTLVVVSPLLRVRVVTPPTLLVTPNTFPAPVLPMPGMHRLPLALAVTLTPTQPPNMTLRVVLLTEVPRTGKLCIAVVKVPMIHGKKASPAFRVVVILPNPPWRLYNPDILILLNKAMRGVARPSPITVPVTVPSTGDTPRCALVLFTPEENGRVGVVVRAVRVVVIGVVRIVVRVEVRVRIVGVIVPVVIGVILSKPLTLLPSIWLFPLAGVIEATLTFPLCVHR